MTRDPMPLGGAELSRARRQGAPIAEPVAVRLWDQVPAVTAQGLAAFPRREPKHHDWSVVAGLDVAVHISDETSAADYLSLVAGLILAKVGSLFVVHHQKGCVAIVRTRGSEHGND
jgi:hypothetical protein